MENFSVTFTQNTPVFLLSDALFSKNSPMKWSDDYVQNRSRTQTYYNLTTRHSKWNHNTTWFVFFNFILQQQYILQNLLTL